MDDSDFAKPRDILRFVGTHLAGRGFQREGENYVREHGELKHIVFVEDDLGSNGKFDPDLIVATFRREAVNEHLAYDFSQGEAATGSFRTRRYESKTRGWSERFRRDFVELTLPYIDSVSTVEDLVAGLIEMRLPPSRTLPIVGHAQTAWSFARDAALGAKWERRAIEMLDGKEWGWVEADQIRWFADRTGMPVAVPDPTGPRPAPEYLGFWARVLWHVTGQGAK